LPTSHDDDPRTKEPTYWTQLISLPPAEASDSSLSPFDGPGQVASADGSEAARSSEAGVVAAAAPAESSGTEELPPPVQRSLFDRAA